MGLEEQKLMPAIKQMKDFEKMLESPFEYAIMLEIHISQVRPAMQLAQRRGKKLILHADLIQGLKNDEYAAEYLCQEFRPAGLISTRGNVILKAKQKGVIAIQRFFLLDSNALEKNYALIEKTRPDYIEVLPGSIPRMITEVREKTGIPVLAGGLIRTIEDVEQALESGATAVTTSNKTLWDTFLSFRKN